MNIEDKYRIKYLISLFKQLHQLVITKGDPEYMDSDPAIVEWVDDTLQKTYGYKDQNERDYLFAAFMNNYYATGGEFDKLGGNGYANIRKISENLGWKPKITIQEGLLKSYKWYKKNIHLYVN